MDLVVQYAYKCCATFMPTYTICGNLAISMKTADSSKPFHLSCHWGNYNVLTLLHLHIWHVISWLHEMRFLSKIHYVKPITVFGKSILLCIISWMRLHDQTKCSDRFIQILINNIWTYMSFHMHTLISRYGQFWWKRTKIIAFWGRILTYYGLVTTAASWSLRSIYSSPCIIRASAIIHMDYFG